MSVAFAGAGLSGGAGICDRVLRELTAFCEEHREAAAAYRAVTGRLSFQLTYARSAMWREFLPWELTGPPLPCAYHDGDEAHVSTGVWDYGDPLGPMSEEAWLAQFFSTAISEVVHEALEWFRVDGVPALDPHGMGDLVIDQLGQQLAADLWEMRLEGRAATPGSSRDVQTVPAGAGDVAGPRDETADDDVDVETTPEYQAAVGRTSFQLTYARSAVQRVFLPWELTGPAVPCAYRDGPSALASGSWEYFDLDPLESEEAWLAQFFAFAISEVVHEALEWFRVDGVPALDPHGPHQRQIVEASERTAARLWQLRGGDAAAAAA